MSLFKISRKKEKEINEDWETTKREAGELASSAYGKTEDAIEHGSQKGASYAGSLFKGKSERIREGLFSVVKRIRSKPKRKSRSRSKNKRQSW